MHKKKHRSPGRPRRLSPTYLFSLFFACLLVLSACSSSSQDAQLSIDESMTYLTKVPLASSEAEMSEDPSEDLASSDEELDMTKASTEDPPKTEAAGTPAAGQTGTSSGKNVTGALEVHFIDVGQGDSILITSAGHSMLIDAGETDQGAKVVSYLEGQGIHTLDYVVATHPHSDHIGGLPAVFRAFRVKNVIMPDVVHTTKAFENFIDGIQLYAIHPIKAQAGSRYDLGTAAFQIVGPEYITEGNLNNDSVAIHLTFGDTAFLFVGDAEADEEVGLRTYALKSDVLKVGHHGSTTSTSSAFLSAVSPSAAVISCGKGNEYGHPAQATLDRLRSRDINIYRTDLSGTIVATSDGEKVTFNTDPSNHGPAGQAGKSSSTSAPAAAAGAAGAAKSSGKSSGSTSSPAPAKSTAPAPAAPAPAASKEPEPAATPTAAPYIGNSNTMKFHRANCSSVKQMKESNKVPIFNRDDAINQGYVPCKRCTP